MLFDTGPPTQRAKQYLQENVDFTRLKYVLITHCHVDHYGLASWLLEETDAEIYLPYRDSLKISQHERRLEIIVSLLHDIGFSEDYIETSRKAFPERMIFPPFPENYKVVEEGLPPHLGVEYLVCPGHSQSDLVFTGPDWAISGDVLLRGIFQSPLLDVDLETGERFRNYDAYCSTLGKLASLRGKKIYPGHRKRVEGVDAAILFYIGKMLDRIEHMQPFGDNENIAKIIDRLFSKVVTEPFHLYLKASEIVFMQDFLKHPKALQIALEEIGLFAKVEDQFFRVSRA